MVVWKKPRLNLHIPKNVIVFFPIIVFVGLGFCIYCCIGFSNNV